MTTQKHKQPQKFITRQALAERWQVTVMTIKRREYAKILTPYKLGRGVRYLLEEVEKIEREAVARR